MEKTFKALLVAGASGGHIFPAQALGLQLRRQGAEVLLVVPRKNSVGVSALEGLPTAYISAEAVSARLSAKTLTGLINLVKSLFESARIVAQFSPDVVVGFGSIVSIPAVLCAWLFRIRTVLHEQNAVPGRANTFLARFSDRICVSFPETADCFSAARRKVAVTGNPLRSRLVRIPQKDALAFFSLKQRPCTVLVMGGSQGSARINRAWMHALAAVPQKDYLQVIHLCGKEDQDLVLSEYARVSIEARVFAFLDEMEYALSCADLAVCRAGATTIAELIQYRVPAVILPYPHAGAHQVQNCRMLRDKGAAVVIEDKDLDSGALERVLPELISPERLRRMRDTYGTTHEDSALKALADIVKGHGLTHG